MGTPSRNRVLLVVFSFFYLGRSEDRLNMEFSSSRFVSTTTPCSNGDTLMDNWGNFNQSRCPSRIMFFGDGWGDFSVERFEVLKKSFLERKTTVEVPMEGICSTGSSVVEFLRMIQTDLTTGRERSIAWIDVEGRCFFPRRIIGFQRDLPVRIPKKEDLERNNVMIVTSPDSTEEHYDESTSTTSWEGRRRWSGSEPVNCDNSCYKVVEKSFVSEILKVDVGVTVTSINRCTFSNPLSDGRRKAFWTMVEATKAARGNPNIRFGWYATSSDGVAGVLQHGFGQQNLDGIGASGCYGRGVHFARPEFLHKICGLPEVDDDGERHVVLCRIIVGNIEKVERGSRQFRPSKDLYDCGVDDLKAPSLYIVWSTHMNTHVIPEYVVSYRLSDGFGKRQSSSVKGMTFSQLIADIERSLPPSAMKTLDMLFDRYKEKKLQKDMFIRQIRSIAGNKLLMEAMKKFRDRF